MIIQKVAGNHKPVHEYSVMLCYVIFQGEYRGIYLAERLGGKKFLPCLEYHVGSQRLYLENEVNQQDYAEEQYQC